MEHLKKFKHDQLAIIYSELELDDNLLMQIQTVEHEIAGLYFLVNNHQYDAAIHLLAYGLPQREAIWWAYVCIEALEVQQDDLLTQNALKSVYNWVQSPSEDRRYYAESCANTLNLYTASSWLAMAVFYAGDNIAEPGRPPVQPTAFMAGQAVANALMFAAAQVDKRTHFLKQAIKKALHVGMGGNGRL